MRRNQESSTNHRTVCVDQFPDVEIAGHACEDEGCVSWLSYKKSIIHLRAGRNIVPTPPGRQRRSRQGGLRRWSRQADSDDERRRVGAWASIIRRRFIATPVSIEPLILFGRSIRAVRKVTLVIIVATGSTEWELQAIMDERNMSTLSPTAVRSHDDSARKHHAVP